MILGHAARAGHSPWDWHPHADVWLLVACLVGGYALALRRVGPLLSEGRAPASRGQVGLFAAGIVALWASSDWPLHDLAEGPMYSLHMVQHLVLTLVAPPLLLLGTPAWLLRWIVRPVMPVLRTLVRPVAAIVAFNLTVALTHWPLLVNRALDSGAAHFAQHAALVATALIMWWPVVFPLPELGRLHPLAKMLYLFAQSLVPTIPASFLTWGSDPLYHAYGTKKRSASSVVAVHTGRPRNLRSSKTMARSLATCPSEAPAPAVARAYWSTSSCSKSSNSCGVRRLRAVPRDPTTARDIVASAHESQLFVTDCGS